MPQSQQKESLRWRLKLIFLYYASYADKNNYKLLKSQNYRRFLIDSEAVKEQASFAPFDIAFRKVHSSAIKLDQFLEMLPVLGQLVYPNKTRQQGFKLFLSQHMDSLYQEIIAQSQFGADVGIIQGLVIEKQSIEMLSSMAIQKAYQKYIEKTSMHQKDPEQTFEQLYVFLTDFEISPKLVYKAMTYLAFYFQVKATQTKAWSIRNLQQLLVCYAELYWKRVEGVEASQETKVVRLLQHMEISEGFKKMVSQTLKENAITISFFKLPFKLAAQLRESRERDMASSLQKSQPVSARGSYGARYSNTKRERNIAYGAVGDLLAEQSQLVTRIKDIFERLCSHGEVGNTQTLKSIKIKRFFKNMSISSSLEQTWVDLTITELCRSSQSGKVELPHFLQLLQIVAGKLNIDWQGFFQYLVSHSDSQAQTSRAYFSTNSTMNNNHPDVHEPSAVKILLQVQRPLEKIFNHYKAGKKGLSYDQLCHFLFEFEIFPGFISKSTLYVYFQKRAKASSQLKKVVGQISLDIIGFLEVLADIGYELGDSLTEEEKVLFLLERMQDSQGHRSILGSEGTNLIGDLRSKYADVYKQNLTKRSPRKEKGFEQLIEDLI